MSDYIRPLDTRLTMLLRSKTRTRGIFNPLPSPALVEMCAFAGFEFVIIDNEHGTADFQATENLLRAARASGIPAAVRCHVTDIARTLDAGAGAIQIPMVNSAAQARDLVAMVKYPGPKVDRTGAGGKRGCAFSTRAAGYGEFGGPAHIKASNEGIALILQVETPEGIDNAGDIAAVEGVDAVFVGTNDLAHAMGCENRYDDAKVLACAERAVRATVAAGKCAGVPAFSAAEEDKYAAWGASYFAGSATGLIMRAFREVARERR